MAKPSVGGGGVRPPTLLATTHGQEDKRYRPPPPFYSEIFFKIVGATLLTKSWSKLVKIGRHWSKDVFGQGDSDDQYPKGAPLVT